MKKKAQAATGINMPIWPGSKSTFTQSKVNFFRNELNLLMPSYFMIRDCIEGEQAIKGMIGTSAGFAAGSGMGGLPFSITNIQLTRAVRYLPQPNAADKSAENTERYKAYVIRAQFYNVTGRTLEGMVGQIFLRDPQSVIPKELEMMVDDATGGGLSLVQVADTMCRHCVAYGRLGILVDFPVTESPITAEDAIEIRPTFTIYHPWDIINWRVNVDNAQQHLTMVVLREVIDEEDDDGFQTSTFEQYRVLTLDEDTGIHQVEIYRQSKTGFDLTGSFTPRDAKGQQLTEIPFHFVGSKDNGFTPNKPPLYDLASMNIGHYRNSADYEESCFIVGQPTPVFTGLSQDWVENVLKGSINLGARASIPLPVGAAATLLQAKENSMPIEAMKLKELQMVAIGAKLVQLQRTAKTATQQIIETTAESSPLSNISKNVSHAIEWALGVACDFVGAAKDKIKYQLNKDFDLTSMTADDQNAVVAQWQSGGICYEEMRTVLRRAGTASVPDVVARAQTQKDIADGLIPDPALANAPANSAPPAKGASDAGGPQPKKPRRQGSPGTTA